MENQTLSVTLAFVDQINQGNVSGLGNFLAEDHVFIDISGKTETGAALMVSNWQDYLENYPDYKIFLNRIFQIGEEIYLIGHTTGSHLNLPEDVEFITEGVIWKSVVKSGKIVKWQLFKDTLQNFEMINLSTAKELYAAAYFARTIAKHLDILPPGARTADVQNVREYYSRLYRNASSQVMIEIAEHLLFDEGYRLVPYELIYFHPGAIEHLDLHQVESLSQGIEDAYSADIFARYIAGPTWDKDVINDELITKWITNQNPWLRRSAIMSTIYVNKDPKHVLKYASLLVEDKDDDIVEALSTVLRAVMISDHQKVSEFVEAHKTTLAPSLLEIDYTLRGMKE